MHTPSATEQRLLAENAELRARLEEAEEALHAIRSGEVDALVVETASGPQVFTLQGLDAESNRFRGEILAQISDAVIVLDDTRHVTYLNAAAERQYRVSAAEVLGRPVTAIYQDRWLHPEDEATMLAALSEHGYWRGENIHCISNDQSFYVESSVSRLHPGNAMPTGLLFVIRDITERKQTEERAHRNELRLRLALDAAYLISFEWNIQRDEVRRYMSTDPGLPPTPEEIPNTFEEVSQIVHPEDRERFTTNVYAALAREDGRYENEFRIIHPDGNIAWLSESGRVERDDEGRPAYLVGLSQDITARKLNEQLLIQSQQRYSGIVESAMDAIITIDTEQRILLFNAAAEKMFDCTAQEAIGTTLTRFIPERFRSAHDRQLQAFSKAGITSRKMGAMGVMNTVGLRSSGEEFPIEVSISQNGTDEGKSFTAILRDISERQRAEEALRNSQQENQLLAELIRFSGQPMAIGYADGRLKLINAAAEALTGYSVEEMSDLNWLALTPPEWHEMEREKLEELHRTGHPVRYQKEYIRKDGTRVPIEVLAHLVPATESQPAFYYGLMTDITERKQAEQALQEADRRKDEFLAMLAHELRNPLAPIRNAVQILRLTTSKEPALMSVSGMIERQVNQLVRLVDDLLDVSRVSRGKIQLQKTLLDLAAVIRQAVETSQPLIEARRHTLNVALPSQTLQVEGDFARLMQVVSNLLNNAAKYTDAGGTIWLSVEPSATSHEALIRVRDTGRGIDAVALKNLFELFYQVDRTLDRSDGGLGIGLSLVKNLVEMHGGRVEAHSAGRGQGSEFIVHLPCLPPVAPLGQTQASGILEPSAHGHRILLVEDNLDVAESMSMLLALYGHQVMIARDGRQGVEMALRERPAVVLMDIGLPYLDGYQACRAMREGGLTDTLIVALSGYNQEEDRRKAEQAGFDQHLAKPLDPEALEGLLALSSGRAA